MVKMVVVVRKDLKMRTGKLAAQVGHAVIKFLLEKNTSPTNDTITVHLSPNEIEWLQTGMTKIVVSVDSEEELTALMESANSAGVSIQPIIDAGRTEFHGIPTMTCCAFGPAEDSVLNGLTGQLRLM
jgi:PTH2 family peptidyl-tRNA hydrolase